MRGFNQTNLTSKLFHMTGETIRSIFMLCADINFFLRQPQKQSFFLKLIQI